MVYRKREAELLMGKNLLSRFTVVSSRIIQNHQLGILWLKYVIRQHLIIHQ